MSQQLNEKQQERKARLAKLAELKESSSEEERSRSRSQDKREKKKQQKEEDQKQKQKQEEKEESQEKQEQQDDQYASVEEMKKAIGFASFTTSKNKDHSKTSCEAIYKNSKVRREYRQYMNRRGGFDRNLDKM